MRRTSLSQGGAAAAGSRVSMLRILGSNKAFCDGLSRRDLMRVGLSAAVASALPGRAAASTSGVRAAGGFGKAKRCVLLYLWGSPSQIDTFDPKPDAPKEVRGPLGSIATALPGVRVGEVLPRTARRLDRLTVLRSLTHPYPIHGA